MLMLQGVCSMQQPVAKRQTPSHPAARSATHRYMQGWMAAVSDIPTVAEAECLHRQCDEASPYRWHGSNTLVTRCLQTCVRHTKTQERRRSGLRVSEPLQPLLFPISDRSSDVFARRYN